LKWSKYTREEVMGRNHRFLKSGDQDDEIFEKLWSTISRGEIFRGEIKNKAKDGSFYWVDAIIAPVLDDIGKPKEYIAQRFVINEAKEKETIIQLAMTEAKQQEYELRNTLIKMEETQESFNVISKEVEAYISGINETMATIEFTKDRKIVTANDIFLKAMGYSLGEIKGKDHRMFVSPEYAESEEYVRFWQALSEGKIQSGEHIRFNKNGEMVKLNASYTPVLDMSGKVSKIIKFAYVSSKQEVLN
jgi:methyl-accepting chemotaxis protein